MKQKTSRYRAALVSAVVGVAFVWTVVLSVSPRLHQQIHADAKQVEHTCAVTFVTAGSCEHSAPTLLADRSITAVQFAKIPTLPFSWIESPFLTARIFEHAPPVNS